MLRRDIPVLGEGGDSPLVDCELCNCLGHSSNVEKRPRLALKGRQLEGLLRGVIHASLFRECARARWEFAKFQLGAGGCVDGCTASLLTGPFPRPRRIAKALTPLTNSNKNTLSTTHTPV